ncbi:hypothetical protein A0H76_839 [Hepatospora eriocheir]|uniref:Uncharacterized protein n=1 Tax=Hepatospora eriocheir TaxID=1081669 RepID=A0A1X0QI52_9MICR|nr:hypothetical protein A0H76_839 [Hepatospora eriocheir]
MFTNHMKVFNFLLKLIITTSIEDIFLLKSERNNFLHLERGILTTNRNRYTKFSVERNSDGSYKLLANGKPIEIKDGKLNPKGRRFSRKSLNIYVVLSNEDGGPVKLMTKNDKYVKLRRYGRKIRFVLSNYCNRSDNLFYVINQNNYNNNYNNNPYDSYNDNSYFDYSNSSDFYLKMKSYDSSSDSMSSMNFMNSQPCNPTSYHKQLKKLGISSSSSSSSSSSF